MRAFAAALALMSAAPAAAQHDAHPSKRAPTLGTIIFPNSGNAKAQEPFLRGVAFLHSFEYENAATAFRQAQRADPTLALAYWGEALTYSHVLWRTEDIPASRAVLQRLAPTAAGRLAKARTARERRFGAAVEAFFTDGTLAQRVNAYADTLRKLAASDPRDIEAAAFASHAVMLAAYLQDRAAGASLVQEAIDLAQRVATASPDHPGATHYLIHLYDTPGMAQQGLAFARAYDKIAPDAEHALHMPSHIYLQLGMWEDVAQSNERAWAASRASTTNPGALDWHGFLWLQYAYLQQGRWDAARALIDTARSLLEKAEGSYTDASVVIPRMEFQYASETGRWTEPLTRPRAPSGVAVSERERIFRQFANYWAAVDAAERRDSSLATVSAPLLAIVDSVRAGAAIPPARATSALVVQALVAKSQGDTAKVLSTLREATQHEGKLTAFVGPPERVFAAELLAREAQSRGESRAQKFFRSADGAEAIRALENVLRIAPNRSRTLLMLTIAREYAGDSTGTLDARLKLRDNWQRADERVVRLLPVPR
ncbi:MAG: hypothetical protein WD825_14700 [Gemmatimonadaceae bacterium]